MNEQPNIYQRLAKVMAAVSYVAKEQKKVNNQYSFVSHDAVTGKVREHFVANGIVTVPRVVRHQRDGNMTEVDVEVDFVNIDNPEDKVIVPCFGYGIDPQDKGPGKAISYAVKYAYLKVLSLETGDDPERDNINHQPAKTTPRTDYDLGKPRPGDKAIDEAFGDAIGAAVGIINRQQLADLLDLIDSTKSNYKKFCEAMKVDDLAELPAKDFSKALGWLMKKQKTLNTSAKKNPDPLPTEADDDIPY